MRWGVLLLLACACSSGGGPAPLAPGEGLRPADAPDVVLLSVSGRTLDLLRPFCPPECNEPYLGEPGDAEEAIALHLTDLGLDVERRSYIAALLSYDDDGDGEADRNGFLQLVADLLWIRDHWIAEFDDPTRIRIVAHSHGCVWAHAACSVMPDVPIDVLISLDGICTQWVSDHEDSIRDFYAGEGGNPYPWDISDPCDAWDVAGFGPTNTEDVAFANVRINLEVQADDLLLRDTVDNRRLDGTRTDILTFASNDSHGGVHQPGTGSLLWVLDRLSELEAGTVAP